MLGFDFKGPLAPLIQSIVERSKQKDMAHLIQPMITEYGSSRFSLIMLASRLLQTVALWAMPPPVVNTSGEKQPRSTSCTRRA